MTLRFNEAAALLPRKMEGSPGGCCSRRTGFNEAAALLPRKICRPLAFRDTWGEASMRPRHYCRGRCLRDGARVDETASFNEAAALLPRKIVCRDECRRGRLGSFNEAAALLPRKMTQAEGMALQGDIASMRPRHYCRGRSGIWRKVSTAASSLQ